jgi:AcrR family transcriptional regulator
MHKRVYTKIKNKDLIDARRNQIIEGALKIFTAKGFHNSTVREIAEAAGLTMGSLYNYIRSKEDIIFIVYDKITRSLREDMKNAIKKARNPEERLKAALLQNLRTVYEYQDIIMFLYKESASLDKDSLRTVLSRETEYIELFEQLLREYFVFKGVRINTTRLRVAADLLSYIPVIMTFRRWSLKSRFDSMETVIKEIVNFVLTGIEFIGSGDGDKDV